jgi:hypothetical protein
MGFGQNKTLRSDFLIHWTGGKDINPDYKKLTPENRKDYVIRLRNTLKEETNGLWMKRNEEVIKIPPKGELGYKDVLMTCFTEIKLSRTYEHTMRYGCLGLGFSREFVISLFGVPVHYVAGNNLDKVTLNMLEIVHGLAQLRDAKYAQSANLVLEETGSNYQVTLEDGHRALFGDILNKLKPIGMLLKPMSNHPGDYHNLDEFEWRILYYPNEQKQVKFLGNNNDPPAKITFKPVDLKIIIFPDDETRKMALINPIIMNWFGDPPDFPIMVTVEECLNF